MKIETIDKDPQLITAPRARYNHQWREIIDNLPLDKMLAISDGKLINIRNNILGTFRSGRNHQRFSTFNLRTSIQKNILYVWKEQLEGGNNNK